MWNPLETRVIDVSRYQYTLNNQGEIVRYMDFEKAKAQGIIAVAIRCTVGDYYKDPCFEVSWENAGKAGLLRSAYHVIAPADNAGRRISAEKQTAWFLSHFGNRDPEFDLVMDCELNREQPRSYVDKVVKGCVSILEANYGYDCMIYTRKYWWEVYMFRDQIWSYYTLWVANWTEAGEPLIPADWGDWHLWQYSAEGNNQGEAYGSGGERDIDLSRVHYPDFFGEEEPTNGGVEVNKYFELALEQAEICKGKGLDYVIELPVIDFEEPPPPVEPGNGEEPPPEDQPIVFNPDEDVDEEYAIQMVVSNPEGAQVYYELDRNEQGGLILKKYKWNGVEYKLPRGTAVYLWIKNLPVDGGGEVRRLWKQMAADGRLLYVDHKNDFSK